MKYASFFSGIGGFELALGSAGAECVYACEIDDFCREVFKARFGHEPQGKDINKVRPEDIPDADAWVGGWPCFPPETPVLTSAGERPIADVRPGDLVLTHQGRFKRVLNAGSRAYAGPLMRLRATCALPLRATPNHKFLAREQRREWRPADVGGWARVISEPAWVEAQALRPGMLVRVPAPVEAGLAAPFGIRTDTDFWWTVGFWLAEGWTASGPRKREGLPAPDYTVTFSCNEREREAVASRIGRVFHVVQTEERTAFRIKVSNQSLWEMLQEFGRGAAGKRIPGWVYALPREAQAAMLEGYLAGDGWRRADGAAWQAITVSRDLARGVQMLAFMVERRMPSLYLNNVRRYATIEGRTVSCREAYMARQHFKNRSTIVDEKGAWALLREVSAEQHTGTVHNLEVEDDHSYTAGGLAAANCQDLSVAGKREGIRGERSGLFWTIMRLVAARRPRLLFLENVPGLLTSNEGQDVLEVLDSLNEAGYLADADICDAQHFGVPQRRRRVFFVGERLAVGAARATELALRGGCLAALEACRGAFGELVHNWGGWPEPRDPEGMRAEVRRKERFFRQHGPPGLWDRLPRWTQAALAGKPHDCAKAGCLAPSPLWGRAEEGPATAGHMEPEDGRAAPPPEPAALGSWLDIVSTACGQPPAGRASMDSLIHDCAEAALIVAWAAVDARAGCPRWREVWPAAAEAAREVLAYAGVAGQDLFVGVEGREEWRRIHGEAELALVALRGLGAPCGPEILPEPEGGAGDSPEGAEEGEGAAPAPEGGAREAGGQGDSPKIAEGGLARALGGVGGGNDYGANKGTLVQGGGDKASAVTSHNQAEQCYRGDGTDNIVPDRPAPVPGGENRAVHPTLTAMGLTGGKGRTPHDYDSHIVSEEVRRADGGKIAPAVVSKWSKQSGGPAGAETRNLVFDGESGGDEGDDPVAFAERTRDGVKRVEVMGGGVSPALTNPGAGGRADAVRVLAPAAPEAEAAPIPFEDDSASSTPEKFRLRAGSCKAMVAAPGEPAPSEPGRPAGPVCSHSEEHGHAMTTEQAAQSNQIVCIQDVRGSGRDDVNAAGKVASKGSDRDTGMGLRDDGKAYTLGAVEQHGVAVDAAPDDGPIAIHADAARSSGGEARTPSPDASGKVRLRDPGLGVARDGKQFTLNASAPHAVAVQDGTGTAPTLRTGGNSHKDSYNTVAVGPPPPVEGVNMRGNKSGAADFKDRSPTLNAMHGHDVHAVAVDQPELPFPPGQPEPQPRATAAPKDLDRAEDAAEGRTETPPVVALDTYNQSAGGGPAPAVRPKLGGDNVPAVAIPPGATAFHRNASCNVADQQGRAAALKANGEHSYQFLGIPTDAPPAAPGNGRQEKGGDHGAAQT